jgi:phage virion morphogenesis protein
MRAVEALGSTMIRLYVDESELRDVLARLADRVSDLEPAMRRVAGHLADAVEEQFASEGRPRWPPLAPSTIRQRARQGKWPGKILQVTGRLAASITTRSSAREAAVGTSVEYGVYHQLGTRRIPARPFLRLTTEHLREIIDELRRFLASG